MMQGSLWHYHTLADNKDIIAPPSWFFTGTRCFRTSVEQSQKTDRFSELYALDYFTSDQLLLRKRRMCSSRYICVCIYIYVFSHSFWRDSVGTLSQTSRRTNQRTSVEAGRSVEDMLTFTQLSSPFAEMQSQSCKEPPPFFTTACRHSLLHLASCLADKLPSSTAKYLKFWLQITCCHLPSPQSSSLASFPC